MSVKDLLTFRERGNRTKDFLKPSPRAQEQLQSNGTIFISPDQIQQWNGNMTISNTSTSNSPMFGTLLGGTGRALV